MKQHVRYFVSSGKYVKYEKGTVIRSNKKQAWRTAKKMGEGTIIQQMDLRKEYCCKLYMVQPDLSIKRIN